MAQLISTLQDPQALISLAVLVLAVVLFISGALAPNSRDFSASACSWPQAFWDRRRHWRDSAAPH